MDHYLNAHLDRLDREYEAHNEDAAYYGQCRNLADLRRRLQRMGQTLPARLNVMADIGERMEQSQ